MFTAIAGIIAAIIGLASGVVSGNNNSYAAMQAAMQKSVDYSREKELTYYEANRDQIQAITYILIIGCILILAVYFISKKEK